MIINNLHYLLAVWTGLEPATPCVTGRYSNQLNYQTNIFTFEVLVAEAGLEPISNLQTTDAVLYATPYVFVSASAKV